MNMDSTYIGEACAAALERITHIRGIRVTRDGIDVPNAHGIFLSNRSMIEAMLELGVTSSDYLVATEDILRMGANVIAYTLSNILRIGIGAGRGNYQVTGILFDDSPDWFVPMEQTSSGPFVGAA